MAIITARLAHRPDNEDRSFGWYRAEIVVSSVVASTLGYLIFAEVPGKGMLYGGALLLGAGFWLTREMSRGRENRAVYLCQCE